MENLKNSTARSADTQPKSRKCYGYKPFVIGLIFECDDHDTIYKIRLKSAIIHQIRQRVGRNDVLVEFVEAKINAKYFRRIDPDKYNAQIWKKAEQELSCVINILKNQRATFIVLASEAIIKYQPAIDLLEMLPHESPNFCDELHSFAVHLYYHEVNPVNHSSGERKCINNTISMGLIGKESTVALLSRCQGKLPELSEVRNQYSNLLVRWCILPIYLRKDFYDRLNRQNCDERIKAHRRWLVDTLVALPRVYTKRKAQSKNISPAKIYGIVIADTKTERMLLGKTKEQYREAASRPGEIRRRLHNVARHTDTWPLREIGDGKIEIYGAIDIYARSIADAVCASAPIKRYNAI